MVVAVLVGAGQALVHSSTLAGRDSLPIGRAIQIAVIMLASSSVR